MAIEVMDTHGIEAMVLSNPIGTKGMSRDEAIPLARQMNDDLAQILARYPQRFGAFAVVPVQDVDASLTEIEYALDQLGFDGICLQTSFEGAYPGDPRFEPLFAELDRRRATVFVHPHAAAYTSAINIPIMAGMVEFLFDSTRAVISLVCSGIRRRYPHFNYIATHGGGTIPFAIDRISTVAGRGTGYAAKLTYDEAMQGLRSIHYDLAVATSRGQLLALRELVPVEQLLLGFDYPMAPLQTIAPAINNLLSAGIFSEPELKAIARGNSLKMVPALAKRLAT